MGKHEKKEVMQPYLKALLAFVSLLLTNLAQNVVVDGKVVPQTGAEWGTLVFTTLVGTYLVWQVPNRPKTTISRTT